MTLADYRKQKPSEAEAEVEAHEGSADASHHPGPWEYTQIGIILFIITAVEVALYYIEYERTLLVTTLMVLSAAKFIFVVLWFMHLKFDNRLFTTLFTGGFLLAVSLFVVVMATLGAGLV